MKQLASLQGKVSNLEKINDQLRASNMCINSETVNNIKPNQIDEKSESSNYNSYRTMSVISKQSQSEHQYHNNRTFNDPQITEFKDTSASLQTESNSLPTLDVSSINVSFMAENDRQMSCNNADAWLLTCY